MPKQGEGVLKYKPYDRLEISPANTNFFRVYAMNDIHEHAFKRASTAGWRLDVRRYAAFGEGRCKQRKVNSGVLTFLFC